MTIPSLTCAKCGYANAPGDQFCGSCGAFLEWEGTPSGTDPAGSGGVSSGGGLGAETGSGAGTGATGATGAIAGAGAGGATGAGAAPGPGGVPLRPDPVGSRGAGGLATGSGGLLRCPACGIANPVSRTFCQSCGTKLTPAAAIPSKSREEIAAAIAAVPGSGPRPTAGSGALGGAGGAAGATPASPPPSKRGRAGWLVAIVVLGVLAGVGVVVVPQLLKGNGPASLASAGPTPSGPAGSAQAAASGPTASAASHAPTSSNPASSGAPTASPPAGKALKLTGASSSSILLGDIANYGPQNAIDGNVKTSWQEGGAVEKGEWIEVDFAPATVTSVVIRNGFQRSRALFSANLRPKNILISVNGGAPVPALLKDAFAAQRIVLSPVAGATSVRITLVDTYASVKTVTSGSPFQDAAISEIGVYGVAGG